MARNLITNYQNKVKDDMLDDIVTYSMLMTFSASTFKRSSVKFKNKSLTVPWDYDGDSSDIINNLVKICNLDRLFEKSVFRITTTTLNRFNEQF